MLTAMSLKTPDLGVGELPAEHGLDPARAVDAEQLLHRRRLRGHQLLGPDQPSSEQRLAELPVLAHREAMARRERHPVLVGVEDLHGRIDFCHEGRRVGARSGRPVSFSGPPGQWFRPGTHPTLGDEQGPRAWVRRGL